MWKKQKYYLSAAEAYNAVAANQNFVYAISSPGIAKCHGKSAKSAKSVSTSEGEVKPSNYYVVFSA